METQLETNYFHPENVPFSVGVFDVGYSPSNIARHSIV